MVRRIALFFTFVCFCSVCSSQNIDLFLGLKTPNIVLAESTYSLDSSKRIGVGFNYTIAFANEKYWSSYSIVEMQHAFTRSFNRSGVGGSVFYEFDADLDHFRKRITLEYRHLKSGNYIDDIGKFSGSNTSDYAEFKESYNNIALLFSAYNGIGLLPGVISAYMELGLDYRIVERMYSIEGAYDSQKPSNRVEKYNRVAPLLRIGLQVKLGSIKK